jgi:capsular polysaccharide biosynthesis protein
VKVRAKLGAPAWDKEDENFTSLNDSLQVLRRRLWVVAMTALVLAGAVTAFGLWQKPAYDVSAKILVSQKPAGDEEAYGSLSSDVQGLQMLTRTVAEAVVSRRVAESALRELNLQMKAETLSSSLSVQPVEDTQFVSISYQDSNPARATEVVNAIANASADQIPRISPSTAVTVTVWEPAQEPEVSAVSKLARDGVLALLLGTMLGFGLVFLLERLDNSRWLSEEAERVSGIPILAVIPKSGSDKA